MVPRAHVTPSKLEELGEKVFMTALHAMTTMPAPSSSGLKYRDDSSPKVEPSPKSRSGSDLQKNGAAEERAMEELVAIGYEAKQAESALDAADWRVEAAVQILKEQLATQEKSSPPNIGDAPPEPDLRTA